MAWPVPDGDESKHRRGGHDDDSREGDHAASGRALHARRPTQGRALAQHAVDASEQEELALAVGAFPHVREQACVVSVFEQVRQPS